VLYPFEGRSALQRVVIEVVFSGGLKNGIMGRNKRVADRGAGASMEKTRLSLRVRGGFGGFKKDL
jgi:hypothetical protein